MNCSLCGSQATKIGDKGRILCDEHFAKIEAGEEVQTFTLQRIDDASLRDDEAEEIARKIEHLRKTLRIGFNALNMCDEYHPAARLGKVTLEIWVGHTHWQLNMSTIHLSAGEAHRNDSRDEHTENA